MGAGSREGAPDSKPRGSPMGNAADEEEVEEAEEGINGSPNEGMPPSVKAWPGQDMWPRDPVPQSLPKPSPPTPLTPPKPVRKPTPMPPSDSGKPPKGPSLPTPPPPPPPPTLLPPAVPKEAGAPSECLDMPGAAPPIRPGGRDTGPPTPTMPGPAKGMDPWGCSACDPDMSSHPSCSSTNRELPVPLGPAVLDMEGPQEVWPLVCARTAAR